MYKQTDAYKKTEEHRKMHEHNKFVYDIGRVLTFLFACVLGMIFIIPDIYIMRFIAGLFGIGFLVIAWATNYMHNVTLGILKAYEDVDAIDRRVADFEKEVRAAQAEVDNLSQ